MANISGGSVVWQLDIDDSKFKSKLQSASAQVKQETSIWTKGMSNFSAGAQVATGAVIAAVALMTKSFVNSASEIQSLRASFESLTGSTAATNKVMGTLYEIGKKTAFENKDIQAAGRNFLAAGVSVEQLAKVLQMTSDVAGATGANLGQLTLPLTQTIARGKLQTQDFYQILNSGAGALRKPLTELAGAKGFGSLAEAMEKGALTSDDLLQVMEQVTKKGGFAFEGALKQSKTFNGQMSNLKEAVTQFGLSLLGVNAITGEVDPSGPFAKLSQAVGEATKFLNEHGDVLKTILTVITVLLTPAFIRLGVQALIAGGKILAGMLLALGPIGLIVAAVVAAGILIKANWEKLRPIFEKVKEPLLKFWEVIKPLRDFVGNQLKSAFDSLVSIGKQLWVTMQPLIEGFKKLAANKTVQTILKGIAIALAAIVAAPIVAFIATVIAGITLWSKVLGFIAKHFEGIKKVIVTLIKVALIPLVTPILLIIGIIKVLRKTWEVVSSAVVTAVTAIYNVVTTVFSAIWGFIKPILTFILNLYIIVWGTIAIVVITALQKIWQFVQFVWNAVYGFVKSVLTTVWSVITSIWNAIYTFVVARLTAILNFYKTIFTAIFNVIKSIVTGIFNFFAPAVHWLYDAGRRVISGLVNGIRSAAGWVWGGISEAAGKIGQFFGGAVHWLWDTGRAIIIGLINGIRSAAGWVYDAVSGIASGVKDKFKSVLGIRSPSRVFKGFGTNITQGLVNGIDKGIGMVDKAVGGLTSVATGELGIQANLVPNVAGNGTVGGSSKVEIQVNMQGVMARSRTDLRDIGVDIVEAINEGLRAKNLPEIGGGKLLEVSSNG